MAFFLSTYNNTTYSATHVAAFPASFMTGTLNSSGTYVVPTSVGSYADDFWIGTAPSSPDPSDFISFKLTLPVGLPAGQTVLQMTPSDSTGPQTPLGLLVQGYNATGILTEQIDGYFPGESLPQIIKNLDKNTLYVFSTANLSPSAGSVSAASLTFQDVPEPASVALLPLMIVALIATRLPAVRAFFAR